MGLLLIYYLENFIFYRTKTDTGKWVEYTKAFERIILKELGKILL